MGSEVLDVGVGVICHTLTVPSIEYYMSVLLFNINRLLLSLTNGFCQKSYNINKRNKEEKKNEEKIRIKTNYNINNRNKFEFAFTR